MDRVDPGADAAAAARPRQRKSPLIPASTTSSPPSSSFASASASTSAFILHGRHSTSSNMPNNVNNGTSTATSRPNSSTSASSSSTSPSSVSSLKASLTLFFPPTSPLYYPTRAVILFALGFIFSVIIDHLQKEHNITRYPSNVTQLFSTASWVPLCCGFSGCLVGTAYPLMDHVLLRRPHKVRREWSSVIRCCGGFIGVNYAASKLPWTSSVQVSITLALLAVGLWFLFDRTWHGFIISAVFAIVGTWVVYMLVKHGAYSITKPDFFGVRSWFPCILYSSSICFGSIGRQLAVIPYNHHLAAKRRSQEQMGTKKSQ
ncbi:Insulin-induced protein 2 protein [Phlyctochytrium planicorne]|nr:Insulin-induced protein 2 protein [Phlyctochytrium planicorne]